MPVLIASGAAISFGLRSMLLKFLGINYKVDGISASVIFLGVDGFSGSAIGLLAVLLWNTYEAMPSE